MYIEEIRDIPIDSYGDVRTLVRGLPYQCPNDWEDVLDSLDEDSNLYLVKEPDNPKDKLAIAAYLDDRRIGYVAADDNCKVWMFLSDERQPCKLIQKYEASFKVSFENPKQLFENMTFEDIYKDKEGWTEINRPVMEIPFLSDAGDKSYDWYRTAIVIRDFEEFIPDFRRKLAAKMIVFAARKNSQGNYRYYLPYINAAVAVVENDEQKSFIDTDGFFIAIPEMCSKTYPGGIHVDLYVARLHPDNPLLNKFISVEQDGNKELVFYLKSESYNFERIINKGFNEDNETTNNHIIDNTNMAEEISNGKLSQDNFDQIDKLTTELDDFVRENLIHSRRVLRQMHRHPHYGYRYDDLEDYVIFIKIFVMNDLCHIYKELKCDININTNEGKILFLYAVKALGNNTLSFETFIELCNPNSAITTIVEYREMIEDFIKQQVEEKLPYYPKNDFLMYEVLEDENLELMDMACEYLGLMNQFAKAVANAKGEISPREQKWLSQLASRV